MTGDIQLPVEVANPDGVEGTGTHAGQGKEYSEETGARGTGSWLGIIIRYNPDAHADGYQRVGSLSCDCLPVECIVENRRDWSEKNATGLVEHDRRKSQREIRQNDVEAHGYT